MTITDELLDEIGRSRNKSRRRESPTGALWVRGPGCDGGLGGKMFGPSRGSDRLEGHPCVKR